jgi:hypothetical protein
MRAKQSLAKRGSQMWLQRLVNERPVDLNSLLLPRLQPGASITWHSPLESDNYAEYRDTAFLKLVGAERLSSELAAFWPERGPQWDALATSQGGDILLVEAKAHVGELCSPSTQASQESRKKIEASLEKTASYLGANPCAPWSTAFYQLANRIAHLYLLRKHDLKAWLVLVNFVGDRAMEGPNSEAEWNAAYQVVWHVLGLPKRHKLAPYVIEIFPKVDAN